MWAAAVGGFTSVFTAVEPGRGVIGWIRMILEAPLFAVLSRLTYTMYLVHFPIILWWLSWWTHPMEFNPASFTVPYLGFVLASLVSGLGLWLLVSESRTS